MATGRPAGRPKYVKPTEVGDILRSPNKKLREYQVENWCTALAKRMGWWCRKFTSPAFRSVPDRIFAKLGRVFWVEFKAWGQVPTPAQMIEHETMRGFGLTVYWVDNREDFALLMEKEDAALQAAKMFDPLPTAADF